MLGIKPDIKIWPLPKVRRVAALRKRDGGVLLQNWVKVDKNGNSKATQIGAILSENILSGTVKTGQFRIQVDFEPAFRDQKVAGSNPVTSTKNRSELSDSVRFFSTLCTKIPDFNG